MTMVIAKLSNAKNCISSCHQPEYDQVHGVFGIYCGARKLVLSEAVKMAILFSTYLCGQIQVSLEPEGTIIYHQHETFCEQTPIVEYVYVPEEIIDLLWIKD